MESDEHELDPGLGHKIDALAMFLWLVCGAHSYSRKHFGASVSSICH